MWRPGSDHKCVSPLPVSVVKALDCGDSAEDSERHKAENRRATREQQHLSWASFNVSQLGISVLTTSCERRVIMVAIFSISQEAFGVNFFVFFCIRKKINLITNCQTCLLNKKHFFFFSCPTLLSLSSQDFRVVVKKKRVT